MDSNRPNFIVIRPDRQRHCGYGLLRRPAHSYLHGLGEVLNGQVDPDAELQREDVLPMRSLLVSETHTHTSDIHTHTHQTHTHTKELHR